MGALTVLLCFMLADKSLIVLLSKFVVHAGLIPGDSIPIMDFFPTVFGQHLPRAYGTWAPYILLAATLYCVTVLLCAKAPRALGRLCEGTPGQAARYIFLMLFPCLAYTFILNDHAQENYQDMLKFIIPFAAAAFVLMPIGIRAMLAEYLLVHKRGVQSARDANFHRAGRTLFRGQAPGCVAASIIFTVSLSYAGYHTKGCADIQCQNMHRFESFAQAIRKEVHYEDVLVSPDIPVLNGFHYACLTNKMIWPLSDLALLQDKLVRSDATQYLGIPRSLLPSLQKCGLFPEFEPPVEREYTICLLLDEANMRDEAWREFADGDSSPVPISNGVQLFRIAPEQFWRFAELNGYI